MTKRAYLASASAFAALFGLGLAQPAAAQDETEVEAVVVTGSFIAGTPKDTAIPVAILSQEELEKRGSPSALEIIKQLPVMGPVLGDSNQFSVAAQGRSGGGTINLRGLGAQRTLVLLNGRRFAAYTADTNLLPIAAIGRVEILKDGAAATYGSDAIGGVANFITRTNFDGLEVQGDYRYVDGSDGDWGGSVLFGWGGESSNILLSAAYQHRSELSIPERDWVLQPYLVNPSGWSVLGNPGVFLPLSAAGAPVAGVTRDANCDAVGGFSGFTGTTPACYFSYLPFDNLVEEEDRYQVYGEFNADLGESHRVHVEGLYSQTNIPGIRFSPGYPPTSGPNGPGSVGVFTVPISNPGAATALQQAGLSPAVQAATSRVSLTLWRPFANGGNNSTGGLGGQKGSRKYEEVRLSASLRGETGFYGIGYEVAATWIKEWQDQQTTDILIDRLQRALNGLGGLNCTGATPGANGCQYYNPFSNAYPTNPALGLTNPGFVAANQNDPALVAWLFDRQVFKADQQTIVLDGVVNGQLWTLPGGEIGWAAGAQVRKVTYNQRIGSPFYNANIVPCPVVGVVNCAFRTGPYIFLGQNIPLDLEQDVWAVFGELALPFTEDINVQLAVRHEDYGGETGSTTNPQLRAKWQVIDQLAVRGSVGTSFRGPTAGNVAPTGVTGLSGIAAAGNNFKSVDFFGNPDVGPEKAFTYSLGAIFQTDNITATVDYWYYKLEDQITVVPANIIATAVAGTGNGSQAVNCASPLRELIVFNNNNACIQGVTVGNDIARIRSDTTNGPEITTKGVDVDFNYRFDDIFEGTLNLGAIVSYVISYKQAAFAFGGITVSPEYEAAGFTNYDRLPGTIPDWRGQFYADFSRGPHNLRWQINYIDDAVDNRGPTTVQTGSSANCNVANAQAGIATNCLLTTFGLTVDSFITHDVTYRLSLPRDLTLTASVFNVLDEDPSQARLELSYDPFIGNPLGRTFKIGVIKRF